MLRNVVLFLEDHNPQLFFAQDELPRKSKPKNSRAHDDDVEDLALHRPSSIAAVGIGIEIS
jgi:hypothetical protein